MKEFEIRDQILDFLEKKGIFCWKSLQTMGKPKFGHRSNQKGVPDILGILSDGTFLGIEVKTDEGRLSPSQIDFMRKAEEKGAMCFTARSLDDVIVRFP